ncbi:MAG: Glycosyl transferase family 2 [Parcubacteria group bacterium GW2011_GWD2_38_11]|nr:MAG: Glycosyl transferase family 2 [Parcubacteria group bacterium GW2011_GWD2_38_11]
MKKISIVIPVYNEEKNIPLIYAELQKVFAGCANEYILDILFVNDGSSDNTIGEIEKLGQINQNVRCIDFSRNFGKEVATTAGLNECQGDACIMLDGDLQHPVELIPDFIAKWEKGAEVVVGIRNENKSSGMFKKIGSAIFYKIINRIAEIEIIPNATDYRLLDRVVIDEFNRFTETNRMTRALVDWLGFRRAYIYFDANERIHGNASYNFWKLFKLAINSFVSLSLFPLQLAGNLGIVITLISGLAGSYILLGKYFFHTPFASTFSDSENLAILLVFLVGIILISIGLLALYIANIHKEVINRPMYIVRKKKI